MQEKKIKLLSFGYKYGLPQNADVVLDMRGLQNPFYVPQLKCLSGRDREVQDYIFSFPESEQYLQAIDTMLRVRLGLWLRGKMPLLCIAVGCTGGRHRSVCMALALAERLQAEGWCVELEHRDIDKGE